jgi:aspartyl-tRNA(Asn)/glutamyl-tRNA(Gln) amidotransferase subunit C
VKFTESEVRYVADLANLQLSPEETHRMAHDLGSIVTYIEKLNQLDTSNVDPMAQVLFEAEETASLREDVERPTLSNEEALRNAAVSGAGYFKIPLVIEK